MAVKIRLRKMGSKKKPFFRIVAAEGSSPRDGRFIESLGTYRPGKFQDLRLNQEKVKVWIQKGAVPTPSVKRLIRISMKQAK